ncbi:hypothetical protein [Cellulosilyticum sp. I15G10I2]|uniref:hypothetical protein n=1 Tax=Cellulosilyticum sp. I15G10I2 TaxID=1892843 RepID=UPI00085C4624|nr:hypothetical protein [Cellulosilyticum sp. I15G10I2]
MRIKRFNDRLGQCYRWAVIMMIMTSLLGIGYGYWSNENIIKAQITIPKITIGDPKREANAQVFSAMSLMSVGELIRVDEDDHEIEITFDIITTLEDSESDIVLKCELKDCKVYLTENPYGVDQAETLLDHIILKEIKVEKKQSGHEVIVKLDASALKSQLDLDGDNYIKIEFLFKQAIPSDEEDGENKEGWEYSYEKVYAVNFIQKLPSKLEDVTGFPEANSERSGEVGQGVVDIEASGDEDEGVSSDVIEVDGDQAGGSAEVSGNGDQASGSVETSGNGDLGSSTGVSGDGTSDD